MSVRQNQNQLNSHELTSRMTELCEFLIRLLRLHCHEQIPKDQTEVFFSTLLHMNS